jgi:hypothetical protein
MEITDRHTTIDRNRNTKTTEKGSLDGGDEGAPSFPPISLRLQYPAVSLPWGKCYSVRGHGGAKSMGIPFLASAQ